MKGLAVFLDANGNYDEPRENGRTREEVLPDYRFHKLLEEETEPGLDINRALERGVLSQNLPDNKVYFINKNFYFTESNAGPEHASKIGAGPEGKGKAGDFDVGYLDLDDLEVRKIELKSQSWIPPKNEREDKETSPDPIKHAEDQNETLSDLIKNINSNLGLGISYSPRIEAWRDAVEGEIQDIKSLPMYSRNGKYLASDEAIKRVQESEQVEKLNHSLFKGWMLGGGENIEKKI